MPHRSMLFGPAPEQEREAKWPDGNPVVGIAGLLLVGAIVAGLVGIGLVTVVRAILGV